jgi:cell division protein FtsI (penicillin-binding protein 3)
MKRHVRDGYLPKIFVVVLLFAVGYGLVVYRLFVLQVRDHERLREMARRQQSRTIKIVPKRGTIYDREGRELAISVDTISLYAVPPQIRDKRRAAKILSGLTGEKRRKILRELLKKRQFVWVARKLNPGILEKLAQQNLDGVYPLYESKRFYPNRSLGAGFLGFVGLDNQGLEGVEFQYDGAIKGKPGWFVAGIDAKRRQIMTPEKGYVQPTGGNDLVLTVDNVIQYVTEVELKHAVRERSARAGMAVMMRPATGEILSMASYPTFNPNEFQSYRPRLRRNLPILENFEPGSTFKLVTLATALDLGSVKPRDIFFCENGAYRYRSTIYHDTHDYAWLSVRQILQKSSNIGAIKISEQLDRRDFYRYMQDFGFGDKTGVALPGESTGVLRSPRNWSGLSMPSLSMGQELSVTALQLLSATAAIANDGVRMQPYMVARIVSPGGKVLVENGPRAVKGVISWETAQYMMRCMESVVTEDGTAPLAAVAGFRVAGKTGTAQKYDPRLGRYSHTKFMSSFVGVVPAEKPEIALIVVLDEPQGKIRYGGYVAGPVFQRIAERTLRYLRVTPPQRPEVVLSGADGEAVPLRAIGGRS